MSEVVTSERLNQSPIVSCPENDVPKLPNEILLHIFSYVECQDLLNCSNVCTNWRMVALDPFLWQMKLCELFGRRWSVISCEQRPQKALDFSDLNLLHPCSIYQFLSQYVPPHLLEASGKEYQEQTINGDLSEMQQFSSRNSRLSIGEYIVNWWNQVVRRFSLTTARRSTRSTPQPYRYAVFGPGFDQRATSRLFSKLVDTRTKSFEPINMIPGRMGFGAGLTLKLYAQAQLAAYDPSVKPPDTSTHVTEQSNGLTQTGGSLMNRTPAGTPISGRRRTNDASTNHQNPTRTPKSSLQRGTDELPAMDDFEFDLHYLYSLRAHLSHTFSTQLERILSSRLFQHPSTNGTLTDSEVLSSLSVTDSMQNILNSLNGMIYAIDARESVEQSLYLYHELHAVIRALPAPVAHLVPIIILYIMPKEDIPIEPFALRSRPASINRSNVATTDPPALNRDSYSGADYTVSWRGSLLLPISCLRLFELENPWRLQKCASNDIKAVIQSIMWLRSRSPVIRTENFPTLLRANSTI